MLISVKAKSGGHVPLITLDVATIEEIFNVRHILFIIGVLGVVLAGLCKLLVPCAKKSKSTVLAALFTD